MAFDPETVETVTVDSYSTLVDVEAAERALADRVDDPEQVSRRWRSRSLSYTLVGNHLDVYVPFYEVNRAALQYALDAEGVDLPPVERDEILAVYRELDVFEDVRDGMERLRDAGYGLYVLSNGDPEMLDAMVDHADVDDLLVDTISADEVATFKPATELYRHAAARTGTPIEAIVHVSALWFDVQGAIHAGMQGVWMNRAGAPLERFGPEPDFVVETLREFANALGVED